MQTPNFRLRQAVHILCSGGIVAYPTEAVWGLGCDPWNEAAVLQLLQLKQRRESKGLIMVAASIGQLDWLLHDLDVPQRARLELSWPGPITWLIPHRGRVPPWVCGDFDTVAVRVSKHPPVVQLCASFGRPLISTSANIAGRPAAVRRLQVQRYFGAGVDYLLPGNLGGEQSPSMIRDLLSDTIVRPQ